MVKKNKLTCKHTVQHRYKPRSDQILTDQKPLTVSGLVQGNQLSPPKVGNDQIISVPVKPEMAIVYQVLTEGIFSFLLQLFMWLIFVVNHCLFV